MLSIPLQYRSNLAISVANNSNAIMRRRLQVYSIHLGQYTSNPNAYIIFYELTRPNSITSENGFFSKRQVPFSTSSNFVKYGPMFFLLSVNIAENFKIVLFCCTQAAVLVGLEPSIARQIGKHRTYRQSYRQIVHHQFGAVHFVGER